MDSDNETIISIYKNLPELRQKVLDRLIVGYSKTKIALDLFEGDDNKIKDHRKQIYRSFDRYLKDVESEEKLNALTILFYTEVPDLVAELIIKLGNPLSSLNRQGQFDSLISELLKDKSELSKQSNEFKFELHKVHKREIPRLQGLGRKYFRTDDHLPTELLKSWYDKDPNYFRKIVNKNGRTVGFFIILVIKQKAFLEFAKGNLVEKQLNESKIVSFRDRDSLEDQVYISVVVGESGRSITNACVLLCLAKYLDEFCRYRTVNKLYATAATNSGRNLMQNHLSFDLLIPGSEREDGEDFFEVNLSCLRTSLFEHLVNSFAAFRKHLPSINFNNENEWKPFYPKRKS